MRRSAAPLHPRASAVLPPSPDLLRSPGNLHETATDFRSEAVARDDADDRGLEGRWRCDAGRPRRPLLSPGNDHRGQVERGLERDGLRVGIQAPRRIPGDRAHVDGDAGGRVARRDVDVDAQRAVRQGDRRLLSERGIAQVDDPQRLVVRQVQRGSERRPVEGDGRRCRWSWRRPSAARRRRRG